VPAGGDEDVGQRVRGAADVGDLSDGGESGQSQLEQPDGVPAVGDRNDQPGAHVDPPHIGLLRPQDAFVHGARQWQLLGLLHSAAAGAFDSVGGRQPDDCPAAEIDDEEVHLAGVDHLRERGRDRRDRVDRRRRPHLVQEFADVQPASSPPTHGADPSRGDASIVVLGWRTGEEQLRLEPGRPVAVRARRWCAAWHPRTHRTPVSAAGSSAVACGAGVTPPAVARCRRARSSTMDGPAPSGAMTWVAEDGTG
jgi:hypothetical protein